MRDRVGKHAASKGNRSDRPRRKEALNDNYTYIEPRRSSRTEFEDVSSYSSNKARRRNERNSKRGRKKGLSRGKKAAIVTGCVLVLLVGLGAWYVFGYLLGGITIDTDFSKSLEDLGITTGTVDGATDSDIAQSIVLDDSVTNIALFGVDARGNSFEGNSDVVMILTIDNRNKKIKMSSILRDSCVVMEDGSYIKLAEVYGYGGPQLAVKMINQNFSIGTRPLNITDYVTVNFAKMADIIDACGGVDIELTSEEMQQINVNLWSLHVDVENQIEADQESGDYESRDDYAYILATDYLENIYGTRLVDIDAEYYEAGTYHLNGNQAVAYGRIRYIDSDNVRVTRQQTVFKALIQNILGMSTLEYPEMIRQIMPLCKTSMGFTDITALLPIIFTDFTIETTSVPSEEDDPQEGSLYGSWIYYYDLDYAAARLNVFIYEDQSPYYGEDIYPGMGTIPSVDSYESSDSDEYYVDETYGYPGDAGLTEEESYNEYSEYYEDPGSGESSDYYYEDPGSGESSEYYYEDPGSSESSEYYEEPSPTEEPSYTEESSYSEEPAYTDTPEENVNGGEEAYSEPAGETDAA